MSPDILALGITWFVVFLFSTTLHEAGHAFAAYRFGDPTAYQGGQVSLNPWPHMRREPFGMVFVPILTFALSGGASMFGWASAPYDPHWAARHHRRAALMAAAGPAANLLLVVLSVLVIRIGTSAGAFAAPDQITYAHVTESAAGGGLAAAVAGPLSVFFTLNLVLLVFNLLPLPPLDGSSIPPLFLSDSAAERYLDFLHQPGFRMFGLLIAWKIFGPLFDPIHTFALSLLYPGITYS